MDKTDDASHAYRGYRRQILFTLNKIITEENDSLVFCPEGLEDLSIELDSNIINIIQVKDYKEPLTLSHIMPKKETSFIRRASHYSRTNPEASIQLVYYNSLGSELNKFIDGNEHSFESLAGKISNGISLKLKDAKKLLNKINFLRVVETDLIEEIKDVLSSSKLGLSLDVSIDFLCWWIYTISEQRLKITKADIINKIEDIGAFLRERTLHHEWLGSIVPFSELLSENIEIEKLKNNYIRGISASINHVNNNLDIIRTDKNREIEKSFKKSNIVIIHGASGQGKTTLGYRYFLDYIPHEFTYQIKEPDNKFHAYDISEAIIKHHKAFNFPICIYYDVQPNDNYWPILIERFYNEKNIKLLLTIREEDWRRSENISEKVDFIDIELNFTKDEAQLIYQKIDQTTFLNFEESWLFFGGDGPLLEYIYLLNWGEKLELRIENQINRLKKMITANLIQKEVIDVLKIIAVITSYESRVITNKVKPLMDATNPELILEELNKEYFIKLTASNNIIRGFHPIRSRIMEKHLLNETFSPWIKVFPLAFPAIIEEDLEVFLLYAFSRRTDNEIDSIIEALNNFSPTSWNTYGGIMKSLLWISIKQYAENNRYIIDDLIERDPDLSFMIALDYDFGNTKPNMGVELIELVKKKNIKRAELIEECRRKQTSKRRVFKNLKIWLEANRSIPLEPISTNEYLGLSSYMFWLSHFNLDSDLLEGICENIEENFKTFDIDLIARLSFSIYSYKNAKLTSILIQNREFITEKLINSTGIIHFEDNKDFVKVSYIVTTDSDKQHFLTSEKDNLNVTVN